MWVSTTRTKHPAPISCKREHTVFALKNKIVEPENSIDAGSKATNALSSRAFMPVGKARNLRRGSRQFVFRIENNYSNLTQKYFRTYPARHKPRLGTPVNLYPNDSSALRKVSYCPVFWRVLGTPSYDPSKNGSKSLVCRISCNAQHAAFVIDTCVDAKPVDP
jgi:hypothetical protein